MALGRVVKNGLLAVLTVGIFAAGWLTGRLGIGSVVKPESLTTVERQFAERMRNTVMTGTFTVVGQEGKPQRPDRYEISSVEKVGDDLWRFNAKMDCCGVGDKGVLPIVVPMTFTGDTPMIMMTDHSLPGLGTFTVRVFFYGGHYSGTWQHGPAGGQMSGRIEKAAPAS